MLRVVVKVPSDPGALEALLEGLAGLNFYMLDSNRRVGGALPALYESGVRYEREPPGRERWLTIAELYASGIGDCEDLAAARVAELRLGGELARPRVVQTPKGSYHAVVERADGTIEDPSLILLQLDGREGVEV